MVSNIRPKWNIIVNWNQPGSLSSTDPSWIDIEPRFGQLSADSDLLFKAQVRNYDGSISPTSVNWAVLGTGFVDSSGIFSP